MFIGHHAVGFTAKRAAPRLSLGWLIAAVMFPDLFWPLVLLACSVAARSHPGKTRFKPPPDARALTGVTLLSWLLPLRSAWFDRHRELPAVDLVA